MDRFLLKVFNKDTNRKSLRHSLSIFIANFLFIFLVIELSVQWTSNGSYVTLFLNRVGILESSSMLNDGFNLAIKNASKLFACSAIFWNFK